MTAEVHGVARRLPGRGARLALLALAAAASAASIGRTDPHAAAGWHERAGGPTNPAGIERPRTPPAGAGLDCARVQPGAEFAGGWAGPGAQFRGGSLEQAARGALAAAQAYLVGAQDTDGGWRSREYAALRDGVALTGPALKVLLFAPTGEDVGGAARRALEALIERAPADVDAGGELVYPVYSAALASIALARVPGPEAERARDAWLALLRAHQLDEDLGWSADDPSHGGWSYAATPPHRAGGGPFEADLSSTTFALGALRLCGVPPDDPAIRKALRFVKRCQDAAAPPFEGARSPRALGRPGLPDPCQNRASPAGPRGRDPRRLVPVDLCRNRADDVAARGRDPSRLDHAELCRNRERAVGGWGRDPSGGRPAGVGGFVLSPTRAFQNKTGVAAVDGQGRERCGAYGSATADGVRALLACGLPATHPRVVAARRWLEARFRTDANPGDFAPARAGERQAARFYWLWSAAHAFGALERAGAEIELDAGVELDWPEAIAKAVLAEQRGDGSWRSAHRLVKEDDPLVATPLAAGALGVALLALQRRGSG